MRGCPTRKRHKRAERTVVVEQLLDEVHVREDHASAAVPLETQLIHGIRFGAARGLDGLDVGVVLVADHLSTGEATHGNDHAAAVSSSRSERTQVRAGSGVHSGTDIDSRLDRRPEIPGRRSMRSISEMPNNLFFHKDGYAVLQCCSVAVLSREMRVQCNWLVSLKLHKSLQQSSNSNNKSTQNR